MLKILLIALLALSLNACATSTKGLTKQNKSNDRAYIVHYLCYQENDKLPFVLPESCLSEIPEDCFDDEDKFDENLGHDTLDCGNL